MENTPYTLPEKCPGNIGSNDTINRSPNFYIYLGQLPKDLLADIYDVRVRMEVTLLVFDGRSYFWESVRASEINKYGGQRVFLLSSALTVGAGNDINVIARPILEKAISDYNDRVAGPVETIPNYEF